MSKVKRIQDLVRDGLYYLTEHADDEATAERGNKGSGVISEREPSKMERRILLIVTAAPLWEGMI